MQGIKLVSIPKEKYNDYRLRVMFEAYKWYPQVYDTNTISNNIYINSIERCSRDNNIIRKNPGSRNYKYRREATYEAVVSKGFRYT